jgi:molybdopterin converting factor subunit 1
MQVKVLFFGHLTEDAQSTSLIWGLKEGLSTVSVLCEQLTEAYPTLAGKTFRVAVNQQFVGFDHELFMGDEVALMPPFSGG